jgi:phosphatidylinositol-3-phosphatase
VSRRRLSPASFRIAGRLLLVLTVLVTVLAAQTLPGTARASAAAGPCRGSAAPVWQHVVWVVMENRSFGSVIGSSAAPYTNSLARSCGVATNYHAIGHPSLPNYLALTSGSTHGVSDDGSPAQHPISGPSLFSQVSSRSLIESQPTPCALHDSGAYLVQHNPQAYYVSDRARCRTSDWP